MRAELVGVGTELLLGQIANTNAQWMSDRLASIGVDVLHHQVVGDNLDRIQDVLRLALDRSDVVLVTGGLGPTEDDITRDALAWNTAAPRDLVISPVDGTVTLDGRVLACEPTATVPMSRRYLLA